MELVFKYEKLLKKSYQRKVTKDGLLKRSNKVEILKKSCYETYLMKSY